MFDADIDALLDVFVADLLVEDDADGGLGHVVDDAGFAVVDFEWHAAWVGQFSLVHFLMCAGVVPMLVSKIAGK